jgi:DNA-directed RNA polymerase specialized sigma24 family protein
LTQAAFDTLLLRLDSDRERAGERFEKLRHTLLQFFGYEGCALPDQWADETLDRLAKRLSEGSAVEDVGAFTRGISKMVLREARAAERREREIEPLPRPESPVLLERDASCLEVCLKKLPAESLALVEQYYFSASKSQAEARSALAQKLGITQEALRSRALRIRKQLERCVQDCRESDAGGDMNPQNSPYITYRSHQK